MKNLFLLFLFITTTFNLSAQNDTIILLPKQGLVIKGDTFLFNAALTTDFESKLDTTGIPFGIYYGESHFDFGRSIKASKVHKKKYKSFGSYYCDIVYNNHVVFEFKGNYIDSLYFKKAIIKYPIAAKTINGLSTGMDYKKIFEKYPETKGSYNCGSGFSYCYYDEGISFIVGLFEGDAYVDMKEKITGFEIYRKIND